MQPVPVEVIRRGGVMHRAVQSLRLAGKFAPGGQTPSTSGMPITARVWCACSGKFRQSPRSTPTIWLSNPLTLSRAKVA